MDFEDISAVVAELDARRAAMGLSYQDVADACDVSKATIYRALTGKTQPTVQLLKNIAAAVQYKPKRPDILPDELTQEAYIAYLKQLVRQKDEDMEIRAAQLHSHYNKQIKRVRRDSLVWKALAIVLIATFVCLFLYDFAHLDRGWIQAMAGKITDTGIGNAFLSLHKWLEGKLWTA